MPEITIHTEDLSVETLTAIQSDMKKYAHLKLYEDLFSTVSQCIRERKFNPHAKRPQDED